ncbi:MAG: carbamate kinase [Caldilineaceae bacterium]|nr:carbamate kinase [Caldilineaceae bacterium]
MPKRVLVAIGGNSLIADNRKPDIPHQWDAIRKTCKHLVDMIEAGWQLIVTHGNGPQAGYILRRNELAAHEVFAIPLDIVVADTQGGIGYMLQQALHNELHSRNIPLSAIALITQTLVDADDPAFQQPSKPIGAFLSEAEARAFATQGWHVMEDAGRGWRRMVASPKPLAILEAPVITTLLDANHVVIAAGGGGIPVVQNQKGELRDVQGVYAVVDKDRASSLLAAQLDVDLLLISTGVEFVAIHYNTPQQQNLRQVTVTELADYYAAGHFGAGSMAPKIEAVIAFVQQSGKPALITDPDHISQALTGATGTWVLPEQKA